MDNTLKFLAIVNFEYADMDYANFFCKHEFFAINAVYMIEWFELCIMKINFNFLQNSQAYLKYKYP